MLACDHLDYLLAEHGQIIRHARGDEGAVNHARLVHPFAASVYHVVLDRMPRSHALAFAQARRHKHPARVAYRGDRLSGVSRLSNNAKHIVVCP
jgi:hypothetical protein